MQAHRFVIARNTVVPHVAALFRGRSCEPAAINAQRSHDSSTRTTWGNSHLVIAFEQPGTFGYGRRVATEWTGDCSQSRNPNGCISQNPPWVDIETELPPIGSWASSQAGTSTEPSSVVLRPRVSFEKNRANSLVRLNANKHYQRFRRFATAQLVPRRRAAGNKNPVNSS